MKFPSPGIFIGLVVLLFAPSVRAIDMPLCNGFQSASKQWAPWNPPQAPPEFWCGPESAYLFLRNPPGSQRVPNEVTPSGTCCPLPKGALTDEFLYADGACPDGFVVTGGKILPLSPAEQGDPMTRPRYLLRCTRIAEELYSLQPPRPGQLLEAIRPLADSLGLFRGPKLSRSDLPVELRFGLGRQRLGSWEEGCVGAPWGAILTAVGPACGSMQFRELRSAGGEPLRFRCSGVSDMYAEIPDCVTLPPVQSPRPAPTAR